MSSDFFPQLGYIILLTDDQEKSSPLIFESYKTRLVTGSIMASELISFSDLFDAYFITWTTLFHGGTKVPIQLFMDRK